MGEAANRVARVAPFRAALLVACATTWLAACGVAPMRDQGERPPTKPGGYYLDDGPQARPPENLDQVPDAQPKIEPIRAANTYPYTAMGKTYVPMQSLVPYRATGHASWYGKRYHGKPTASGEPYDMYAMTAAHPILPIPSYARVRNLSNERTVVVRINDRGPFHADRLIDLSYTAAYKLGVLANGSALVEVESILPGADAAPAGKTPPPTLAGSGPASAAQQPEPIRTPPGDAPPGVYVQLGAFSLQENAQSFLTRIEAELNWLATSTGVYLREGVYRVQTGPYRDRSEAAHTASRIEQAMQIKPVIVTR